MGKKQSFGAAKPIKVRRPSKYSQPIRPQNHIGMEALGKSRKASGGKTGSPKAPPPPTRPAERTVKKKTLNPRMKLTLLILALVIILLLGVGIYFLSWAYSLPQQLETQPPEQYRDVLSMMPEPTPEPTPVPTESPETSGLDTETSSEPDIMFE